MLGFRIIYDFVDYDLCGSKRALEAFTLTVIDSMTLKTRIKI